MSATAEHRRKARRAPRRRRRRLPAPGRFLRGVGTASAEALRPVLDEALYGGLSPRQRTRLVRQLELIDGWARYCAAAGVKWGCIERAMERFVEAARVAWRGRLSRRTFDVWLKALAADGIEALIDRRGRPRRTWPIDAVLWKEFNRLLRGGVSVPEAHARMVVRAVRERRRWPSLRTVQVWLRDGRVVLHLKDGS